MHQFVYANIQNNYLMGAIIFTSVYTPKCFVFSALGAIETSTGCFFTPTGKHFRVNRIQFLSPFQGSSVRVSFIYGGSHRRL